MKIYIHEADEEKDIRLNIPNGLIFNRLGTMIAGKMIKNRAAEAGITEKQIKRMMKEMKKAIKQFGHFELVDIETSEGEIIKIIL